MRERGEDKTVFFLMTPRERAIVACALALAAVILAFSDLGGPDAAPPQSGERININTAPPEMLRLIPGIGAARSGWLVLYRARRGGFKDTGELAKVRGLAGKELEEARRFAAVEDSR